MAAPSNLQAPAITLSEQLEACEQGFFARLVAQGYASGTLHRKKLALHSFFKWAKKKRLGTADLDRSHAEAFAHRSSRRSKDLIKVDRATVRQLIEYLAIGDDRQVWLQAVETDSAGILLDRYISHLRNDKGLAENSIAVYRHYIRDFLTEMDGAGILAPAKWTALTIRDYVLRHVDGRSAEYTRLLAISLRSFLRYLHFAGERATNLSRAIPMTRKYSQSSLPMFLPADTVERLIKSTDPSSASGSRDRAILLLLARLGLRAGEIANLELDDIRWRSSEIVIRGKGRRINTLPLLKDVGEALSLYLRNGRSASDSRRVFLRNHAPHTGFAGPAAIGHIARAAFARTDVHRVGRGAAHLFRHSLATRMIRCGASVTEIGEVLRHRSPDSTLIYAKVSIEALRGVARQWPALVVPS